MPKKVIGGSVKNELLLTLTAASHLWIWWQINFVALVGAFSQSSMSALTDWKTLAKVNTLIRKKRENRQIDGLLRSPPSISGWRLEMEINQQFWRRRWNSNDARQKTATRNYWMFKKWRNWFPRLHETVGKCLEKGILFIYSSYKNANSYKISQILVLLRLLFKKKFRMPIIAVVELERRYYYKYK